jgi:ABC-2 type transport system permease protein
MNKTTLIIQREYLSRVKNRTFILTTILTPLLFVLLIGGSVYLSMNGKDQLKIAVVDENGYFKKNLQSNNDVAFEFTDGVDTSNYADKGYSAILIIPKFDDAKKSDYSLHSKKGIGIGTKGIIEEKINRAIEDKKLQDAGLSRNELDSIHQESQFAELKSYEDSEGKTKESNQGLAYGVGYGCGFLIYLIMIIYGMMVLRGVMEEKTNRIAEVIVSSVKPFQLMMGKIIGIGAVGITQFLMWVVLIVILSNSISLFVSHDVWQQVQDMQQHGGVMGAGVGVQASSQAQLIYSTQHTIGTANWPVIIGCFIFYFITGFLFYASLFAAVGSVVEDVQNAQSLTLPITMPIIFSFIIMSTAVQVPGSKLAVWASIIPFSAPTVMMARIAYGVPGTVPYWQLFLSMALMIIGFLFTTCLAGKIYRTGILLYGKKPSWKEMFKWAFRKN